MASSDNEIVVDDPDAPADDSPPVTTHRPVEIVVYVLLIALAAVLAYDNWRSGAGWAREGPQSGYMPFYLSLILAGASVWGIGRCVLLRVGAGKTFVTRDQLRRVLQVFVPTLVFCVLVQWLGIYVGSFLLVAGFMRFIGKIAWWKALVTAFLFSLAMFLTFEMAFDVIMPKGPLEAAFGF